MNLSHSRRIPTQKIAFRILSIGTIALLLTGLFIVASPTGNVYAETSTTTSLNITPSNPYYGQSLTLTATVSPTEVTGIEVTGTVGFLVDGVSISSCASQSLTSGVATCGITAPAASATPYSYSAVYSGDINYFTSTGIYPLTVTTRPITVTADSGQTKEYGQTDPASFAYQVTSGSLVGTDSISGALTRVAGENVGSYAINQGSLSAGSNYDLTYVSRNFSITAKPITVIADSGQTKEYGQTDPASFAYQVTSGSLVGTDSISGALTRVAGENVGAYAINQGSLSAGSNYDLTYVSHNFSITAKSLSITANNQTKLLGTTFSFAGTEFISSGLVSGDSVTSVTLTSSGAAAAAAVGEYDIVPSDAVGTGLTNYTISYHNGKLTVTPGSFSISGTITYNGTGLKDVTVTAGAYSALTGNDGSYTFNGLPTGDYEVIPALAGYTFTPDHETFTSLSSNKAGVNFTATNYQPDRDASLSNLGTNLGYLYPAFSPSGSTYTIKLGHNFDTIQLTPTVNQSGATIKINNVTAASGAAHSISLDPTKTTITILVTAKVPTITRTYTITVTRLSEASPLRIMTNYVDRVEVGSAYSYTISSTSDYHDAITYSINSGPNDWSKPAWLTFVDHLDGTATLSGNPTMNDLGISAITIYVTDTHQNTTSQTFILTVSAPYVVYLPLAKK